MTAFILFWKPFERIEQLDTLLEQGIEAADARLSKQPGRRIPTTHCPIKSPAETNCVKKCSRPSVTSKHVPNPKPVRAKPNISKRRRPIKSAMPVEVVPKAPRPTPLATSPRVRIKAT